MHRYLAVLILLISTAHAAEPVSVELISGGKAKMPIVVGEKVGEEVRKSASTLADYLGRMSGADFEVVSGDGSSGIVVGIPADFEKLPFDIEFEEGPFNREHYILRSLKGGVWIVGSTGLAVRHAVWDLLYRLGHRQFFPGETWEVVPQLKDIAVAVDADEKPDFYARRIWYNWGTLDYNRGPYTQWCARNRAVQGFSLSSGHSYGAIIAANRKEFEEHPEYAALVGGQRKLLKFCISNPGLRKLVVEDAKRRVTNNPTADSISRDPSDGGGWCECNPCKKMGSVSDRALTLANESAAAINELGFGTKYVGMYAYNVHCAPPSIKVHPNVIISATTAFIRGGFSFDQIIEGWQAKGATMGVYDYYSVIAWDWNRPRAARGARPAGLAASIRKFHGQGARFLDAESGDAWGPYGLGYYVAVRVMWDISQADRVKEIVDDFLTRAFGPAKKPMSQFYELITVDAQRRSSADLVGRMYRYLKEARELAAKDSGVRRRIDDLILYTRYAELYDAFASGSAAKEQVLRHSYRMRKTMMVHMYGLWARLASQQAVLQRNHPAISDEPFTEEELLTILKNGIANNQPVEVDFERVEYSKELVPAFKPLALPKVPPGSYPPVPQDRQTYYVWVDEAPAEIHMKVTTQRVWNLRPHKITLFSPKDVHIKAVDTSSIVKPDGKQYDVILKTPYDGLHRIEVVDGGDYTRIVWAEGMPVTLPGGQNIPGVTCHFRGGWTLYFYVPKGTKTVSGWAARIANWSPRISGTMNDSSGTALHDFGKANDGWFSVPVPDGQDGRLWKFQNTQGVRFLMTVPPYFARTAEQLLLPKEVVEADSK